MPPLPPTKKSFTPLPRHNLIVMKRTTAAGTAQQKDVAKTLTGTFDSEDTTSVKVYILDLRGMDAWNWEWALAKCSDSDKFVSTQETLYTDCFGDFVLFDGDEAAAIKFYTDYCRKYRLDLVSTHLT